MEGKKYATKLGNDIEKQITKPLKIMHLGACGPMNIMSMAGPRYFVTFVDDFARNEWVYKMKYEKGGSIGLKNSKHLYKNIKA
jgi:hypothetical protein